MGRVETREEPNQSKEQWQDKHGKGNQDDLAIYSCLLLFWAGQGGNIQHVNPSLGWIR